jgi:hypothetical protein
LSFLCHHHQAALPELKEKLLLPGGNQKNTSHQLSMLGWRHHKSTYFFFKGHLLPTVSSLTIE